MMDLMVCMGKVGFYTNPSGKMITVGLQIFIKGKNLLLLSVPTPFIHKLGIRASVDVLC